MRPARLAGLPDRGRIDAGQRADLVRVRLHEAPAGGAPGLARRRTRRLIGSCARVAVYYAPLPDDPLFAEAATWLGRDPESDAPAAQPDLPDQLDLADIAAVTEEPRLYGFHATLKPPMRLADGRQWFDVLEAANALAGRTAPFDLPALAVSDVHGFLALRETVHCPPLQALADACVADLDPFRAPPSEAELARRRRAS